MSQPASVLCSLPLYADVTRMCALCTARRRSYDFDARPPPLEVVRRLNREADLKLKNRADLPTSPSEVQLQAFGSYCCRKPPLPMTGCLPWPSDTVSVMSRTITTSINAFTPGL
jgi:hypothetical protein